MEWKERLSQRRGQGLMILDPYQLEVNHAADSGLQQLPASGSGSGNTERLQDEIDGAVTVEELNRDEPLESSSTTTTSPSSKFRFSLPGCSPRPPHSSLFHGSIFSFPSYSYGLRRRWRRERRFFYPWIFPRASYRLPAVAEKPHPVGDPVIQIEQEQIAVFINKDPSAGRQQYSLFEEPSGLTADSSLSISDPAALLCPLGEGSSASCQLDQVDAGLIGDVPIGQLGGHQCISRVAAAGAGAGEQRRNEDLICALRNQDHQWFSTGGVLPDENRTAHQQQKQHVSGCCCCGAKRNVSFSCFIRGLETLRSEAQGVIGGSRSGGAVPLHLQLLSTSIISEVTCSCANHPKAPIPADEESEDADVKDRPIIPPQDYSFIMDSGRQVVTPPLSAGTNQVGATTKSIDGYGMQADAAQQSPPVVMSSCSTAPLTIFSSALHSSCHQHQLGSRMASSNCPAQGIINVKTTPSPSGILINSSQATSSSSYCSDGNPPDRPARRSRSPKELNETAAGRDRRAFSADRPIVLTAVVNIPTTTSGTISAASRAKTRSAGPTKVERLRQLTQRLRPSSLSSVPPAFIEPVVVQTEQQVHTNCNHLPPLPVAPPRHPDRRGKSDRKISTASKSVKRDSATSTTDLGVSPLSSSASVLDAADGVPPAPTESGGAKNSDIVRKKTAAPAGSSAEVTRPSLFWSSPPPSAAAAAQTSPPFANNTTAAAAAGQRVGSGLFSTQLPFDSSSDRRSGGRTPSASIGGSGCDDIFDDDFQEHLKLNPRILVGTYTQRTIPFRSASFSQIDHVGNNADGVGTYSRRPRTSITLKPVTYSIGRTETTSPQQSSTTCSLPRKLKISPDAVVTSPGIQPPPTPDSSHTKLLWKNPSSSSEEFDPDPTETIGLSSAASPLVVSNDTSGNEDVLITLPKMEESSTTTETNSDTSSQIKTADYETTEISVTAEIPWVPHNPKNPSEEPINPVEDPVESLEDLNTSSSLKALPVLDLLELNNHLLRLKAACCSSRESGGSISALDQLADLEVAAQFSDNPSGAAQKTSSDPVSGSETERRPSWLTEILRLTNGESNSSLSDEGCVPDSHNPSDKTSEPLDHTSAPIIEHQHPVETCAPSIMAPSNKPSPQLERNHSVKTRQRRRSSSLVLAGSSLTLTADSGLCTKSNSARSLTFLTPPSSKSETGEPSFISSSSEQQQQQEVAPPLASGQLATDDSISTETYVVDAFKPVGQDGASPTEKAVLTKDDNCDASVGQLLVMNSNHRTSAGSDEQDDEELLKANKDTTTSHRLTVSVNLTLADDNQGAVSSTPASSAVTTPYRQNTPSPFSPDQLLIDSNSCGVQQKSPLTPRRYGLKRRPLRGPYGEMLEAEMNKSEFGKMYSSTSTNAGVKRNTTAEDLTFLREPNLRIITNREAKSSSPRPLISPSSAIIPDGEAVPISAISPSINYSVRQNSLPLPTSHSLDDSQLKVGYNTLPSTLPSSATVSPTRLVIPPKRKISANLPYVFSDGDLELSNQQQSRSSTAGTNRTFSLQPSSAHQVKQQLSVLSNAAVTTSSSSNHQRTSSSPCQLIQFTTETGFTSEDEPELLELTTLSSALSRSTARLLDSSTTAHQDPVLGAEQRHTLPLPRVGSAKRQRVSGLFFSFVCI